MLISLGLRLAPPDLTLRQVDGLQPLVGIQIGKFALVQPVKNGLRIALHLAKDSRPCQRAQRLVSQLVRFCRIKSARLKRRQHISARALVGVEVYLHDGRQLVDRLIKVLRAQRLALIGFKIDCRTGDLTADLRQAAFNKTRRARVLDCLEKLLRSLVEILQGQRREAVRRLDAFLQIRQALRLRSLEIRHAVQALDGCILLGNLRQVRFSLPGRRLERLASHAAGALQRQIADAQPRPYLLCRYRDVSHQYCPAGALRARRASSPKLVSSLDPAPDKPA